MKEVNEAYQTIFKLEELEQENVGKDEYIATLEAKFKEADVDLEKI